MSFVSHGRVFRSHSVGLGHIYGTDRVGWTGYRSHTPPNWKLWWTVRRDGRGSSSYKTDRNDERKRETVKNMPRTGWPSTMREKVWGSRAGGGGGGRVGVGSYGPERSVWETERL